MATKNQHVTKGILNEAPETVLAGIDKLISEFRNDVSGRFGKVDGRLEKVEAGI